MTRELKPYTIDDLITAVSELQHHRATLKSARNELNAKRAAIKSFEDVEATAAAEVARHEAHVLSISKALK